MTVDRPGRRCPRPHPHPSRSATWPRRRWTRACVPGSRRRLPVTCTSATCAPRCSPGRWRAATAARSCCASRTPTAPGSATRPYAAALDVLHWIGIDWDEGPEVGGPYAPYRQSERLEIYAEAAARLRASGAAYPCYCTPAELAERRDQASAANKPPGYDGRCRTLTAPQRAAFEAEGRTSVLRFWMPDGTTTWNDLVRGEITIDHANVPDFAHYPLRRSPALPAGGRRRRRRDGSHPHRARGRSGDGDSAAARALRGARAPAGEVAGLRSSAADHRRRQTSRCPSATVRSPSPGTGAPGSWPRRLPITWPCSAGLRGAIASSSAETCCSRSSMSAGSARTRHASTSRSSRR